MNTQNPKVLFALDPLSKVNNDLRKAARTIRNFANQVGDSLQAVAVLSPDQIRWPQDFTGEVADQFYEFGSAELQKKQKALKINFDAPAETLMHSYRSTRGTMSAINDLTKRSHVDYLAVVTHLKKKSSGSLFGFVSSLASTSQVPILAVNAEGPEVRQIRTILFASDFGPDCREAFIKVLELAMRWKAKLVVFHKMYSLEAFAYGASMYSPAIGAYEPLLLQEQRKAEAQAEEWKRLAAQEGVDIEIVFTRKTAGVGESVVKTATKKNADLIVVVAQTGRYASIFFGSVTRFLLQKSKLPILILRQAEHQVSQKEPRKKSEAKAFEKPYGNFVY